MTADQIAWKCLIGSGRVPAFTVSDPVLVEIQWQQTVDDLRREILNLKDNLNALALR